MDLDALMTEFREGLRQIYGERLARLVLFGSRARDNSRPDSDIDLLVVLHGSVDVNDEIRRVSPLSSRLSLQYDTVISCLYVSERDFENDTSPLMVNIRREGLAA